MEANNKAMRETLEAVKKSIDDIGASSLDCDPVILMASLTQVCARLSARIERALAEPPRNCDIIPDWKLVDEFCRYLGYDPMNPKNGYADGQDRFIREHWFEFSKWIVMPYKQEGGAK